MGALSQDGLTPLEMYEAVGALGVSVQWRMTLFDTIIQLSFRPGLTASCRVNEWGKKTLGHARLNLSGKATQPLTQYSVLFKSSAMDLAQMVQGTLKGSSLLLTCNY